MKNILKRIAFFSIVLILSISNINSIEVVNAITIHKSNTEMEIYSVNEKINTSNTIIDYYKNDPNKEEFLNYKKEQERLEQERLARINLRDSVADFSKLFIGNPYVIGGTSLTNGADCSGFVQSIYKNFGYELPRTTVEQSFSGIYVTMDEIQIGDIVSYGYEGISTHSSIYIGDGMIIHASTPELGIRLDNMGIMPIVAIRRIIY